MATENGTLYICGTPIGNLEDLSPRVQRILGEVHLIAAEDTRHSGRLLQHFNIRKPLISYHEHNEVARTVELLECLQAGESIALISDAGMPGISDPGQHLVSAALAANIRVVPVPGPSAAITALVASGLPAERYVFEGFLPRQKGERTARIAALAAEERTIIIYEAPHRLVRTLTELAKVLGNRRAVLARELTKMHEEFISGDLTQLADGYTDKAPRGEYVVIIEGQTKNDEHKLDHAQMEQLLKTTLAEGVSVSEAARLVANQLGLSRRIVYQAALDYCKDRQ